ncbi:hypothetical protein DL93DRAFT_2085706 [Clavulina sp. PMI_390]|nr:hypothetical protein DL93DRAFT_2085706 [Clavulina sp. PMI_390]
MAASGDRKLSKTQTLQTDIGKSIGVIVNQEQEPMILRVSGQLLLGVVRIYSRKAKYLLDDCNEAIVKIKLAFRPGVVDMTEEQLVASKAAITLDADDFDADFLPQNMDWAIQPIGNKHIANQKDITLANATFMDFGFDDNAFDFGGEGFGAGDDWGVDTGLTFGDDENEPRAGGAADDTMSIELGRHDAGVGGSPRISIASHLRGDVGVDRDMSILKEGPGVGDDFEMGPAPDFAAFDDTGINFGDADLGLTFDEPMLDPKTPGRESRASTPLSEPPRTPPPGEALGLFPDPEPTPRTAQRIAELADSAAAKKRTKPSAKKVVILDSVLELADQPGFKGKKGLGQFKDPDVSEITTEQRFLRRSKTVMKLLEIQADPVAHFMPTVTLPGKENSFFYAGPPGLPEELKEMFMFPVRDLRRGREDDANPRSAKKARIAGGAGAAAGDESVELGMRAASQGLDDITGLGPGGDTTMDFGAGLGEDYAGAGADFTFDTGAGMGVDMMDIDLPDVRGGMDEADAARQMKHRSVSRLVDDTDLRSTPGLGDDIGGGAGIEFDTYDSQSCTIGLFDMRSTKDSQSQSQSLNRRERDETQQEEAEQIDKSTEKVQSKGFSKNTVKAMAVIKKGLESAAAPSAASASDAFLSFNEVASNASRKAASAFFFELLVLSTRDCVKLGQGEPFANIEVRAKDKFWETAAGMGMGTMTAAT